ncbi:uncharacterized protein LOC135437296 [Drosophila montana]|uniref:uncharacterized protein LOC135437296 n=1 Tax=Drosophila montana TaxID=40370 RepID=UPI00313CC13C
MKRIYRGTRAPKYHSGKWSWDKKTDSLKFELDNDLSDAMERYIETNGYKFLRTITPEEELIYRQKFARSETTFDYDTLITADVLELVIFLMPKEFLTKRLLIFLHQPAVLRFFHALNIYFEYFLRLVELVLIRRDELSCNMAQIQSEQTIKMKRIISIYLSQYRLLVARNYSVILKGEGDMAKFHHINPSRQVSATIRDKWFHEQFLAVSIQIVWISMHRRAYNVIEMEMNRLFRSEHFMIFRPEYLKLTPAEKSLLYGRNNKIVNYRIQVSPLIQELENVPTEDLPILWIGERKYRGTDIRIATIELEFIVPCAQLHLIDVPRGIMGHPKRLYDTLLNLNWPAVREEHFTLENDPYHILRQPHLQIPNIDDTNIRKMSKHYEHFLGLYRIYEPYSSHMLSMCLRRESIISVAIADVNVDIYNRCEEELASTSYGPKVDQVIENYFKVVSRLRKSVRHGTDDSTNIALRPSAKEHKVQKTGDEHFFK